MIIDPDTQASSDGERSPLKSTPPAPNYNANAYNQPPPPYIAGPAGYHSGASPPHSPQSHQHQHLRPVHSYNDGSDQNSTQYYNPNPQPFKRLVKAFTIAAIFIILWGVFVDSIEILVNVKGNESKRAHDDDITAPERYVVPGRRFRKLYAYLPELINDSWLPSHDSVPHSRLTSPASRVATPTTPLLNPSSAPQLTYPNPNPYSRALPMQYPPPLSSFVTKEPSPASETNGAWSGYMTRSTS
ncbi:hypothetical protein CVT24_009814 [Panaeolus cyanescens]|uniref:Uncharacterized protein n=1 Tax=Panaeolus cyanescens TaxID=181874 RepID=A0A409WCM3_9AGAR|nr:hypothetical protein CVT24_009814 [Panaeolus cyanescens]